MGSWSSEIEYLKNFEDACMYIHVHCMYIHVHCMYVHCTDGACGVVLVAEDRVLP